MLIRIFGSCRNSPESNRTPEVEHTESLCFPERLIGTVILPPFCVVPYNKLGNLRRITGTFECVAERFQIVSQVRLSYKAGNIIDSPGELSYYSYLPS